MPKFTSADTDFYYEELGDKNGKTFIWGHGWGHSHEALMPLVKPFEKQGHHIVLDFPGFGQSPEPPEVWSSADYADAIAAHIRAENLGPIIWAGHSFGGRVGLQLASRHPELVERMFLIAAAGLKVKKPFVKNLYFNSRVFVFKALKKLIPLGLSQSWLYKVFGSSDYNQSSGIMRSILVNAVNEDQSENAARIQCPTHLIYGRNDTETPPDIGLRLEKLIPGANLTILDGQDHYSVLSSGRHPVIGLLSNFIK